MKRLEAELATGRGDVVKLERERGLLGKMTRRLNTLTGDFQAAAVQASRWVPLACCHADPSSVPLTSNRHLDVFDDHEAAHSGPLGTVYCRILAMHACSCCSACCCGLLLRLAANFAVYAASQHNLSVSHNS